MLVISAYLIKKLLPGGVRLDRELELSVNRRHTDVYRLHHSQARLRHYCKYCLKIINNFKDFIKKRSQHEPVLTVVFPFFKIKMLLSSIKAVLKKLTKTLDSDQQKCADSRIRIIREIRNESFLLLEFILAKW